jgi:hypothetical protein
VGQRADLDTVVKIKSLLPRGMKLELCGCEPIACLLYSLRRLDWKLSSNVTVQWDILVVSG